MKIKQKRVSKKIIIIGLIAALIVGMAAYIVYAQSNTDDKKARKPITYSGPSEQDKKDAADNKANVAKRQEIEQQAKQETSSSKKQVSPVITNANQNGQQVTVTGYVSGVFEDGGTCTLVASKDGTSFTRTSKGFADATTTSCSPFFIDRSAFSEPGSWTVKISYSSSNAEGTSQTRAIEIQ
ncbi:MAG: hypothetical protein Q7T74_04145 [Candidatus Saccharibacteria bacterium]|nr:hypothetical protein [Candidatus Saccharibacteria bacterium]